MRDTSEEMVSSMELYGPDGRIIYLGKYLTDDGVERRFPPGKGPYPTEHVTEPVVAIATGELYTPPTSYRWAQ